MPRRYLLLVALFVSFVPMKVFAKVGDAEPVRVGDVEYASHANVVTATSLRSGQRLWSTTVYPSIEPDKYDPDLERDVQWNIIVSLRITNKKLEVKNRRKQVFYLDLKTGNVVP